MLLLLGGDKSTQMADVARAQESWKAIRAMGIKEFAAKVRMASPNVLRAISPRHNNAGHAQSSAEAVQAPFESGAAPGEDATECRVGKRRPHPKMGHQFLVVLSETNPLV